MKPLVKLSIACVLAITCSITGCDQKVESEYIPQCASVSGGTMEARNENCKSCCRNNGWDNGTYWELGAELGCECLGND